MRVNCSGNEVVTASRRSLTAYRTVGPVLLGPGVVSLRLCVALNRLCVVSLRLCVALLRLCVALLRRRVVFHRLCVVSLRLCVVLRRWCAANAAGYLLTSGNAMANPVLTASAEAACCLFASESRSLDDRGLARFGWPRLMGMVKFSPSGSESTFPQSSHS
jgi:hypothetical protein